HPKGKQLITAGRGEQVKVWDITTEKMVDSLQHHVDAECLAVSPEGEWLVVGGRGEPPVAVWNLQTRAKQDTGKFFPQIEFRAQDFVYAVAFLSKTSGLIANKNQAHVWDQDKNQGKVLSLPGYSGRATSLAISRQGWPVAASFDSGSVMIWEEGKLLFSSRQQFPRSNCVALSPSGQRLAVARAKVVTVENWPGRPGPRKLQQGGPTL